MTTFNYLCLVAVIFIAFGLGTATTLDIPPQDYSQHDSLWKISSIVRKEIQKTQSIKANIASEADTNILTLKILYLKRDLNPVLARKIAGIILKQCKLRGENPDLVISIIKSESNFLQFAKSHVGALGLMQIMPKIWIPKLGLKQSLFDIETNISAGIQVLQHYRKMYGYNHIRLALTAYNRGEVAVDRDRDAGKHPWNGYAKTILDRTDKLASLI